MVSGILASDSLIGSQPLAQLHEDRQVLWSRMSLAKDGCAVMHQFPIAKGPVIYREETLLCITFYAVLHLCFY